MRTVLIAQLNSRFANALAAPLAEAGYRTITCPGPWPPALRCIRCDVGFCPLTEAADLLIYDPDLVGYDEEGRRHRLATDSAYAHPDLPLLLAWPQEEQRPSLDIILEEVPRARLAAFEPDKLVEQVWELIGPPNPYARAPWALRV